MSGRASRRASDTFPALCVLSYALHFTAQSYLIAGKPSVVEAAGKAFVDFMASDYVWPPDDEKIPDDDEILLSPEAAVFLNSSMYDVLQEWQMNIVEEICQNADDECTLEPLAAGTDDYSGVFQNTIDLVGAESVLGGGGIVLCLFGFEIAFTLPTFFARFLSSIGLGTQPVACYPNKLTECENSFGGQRKSRWNNLMTAVHAGQDTYNSSEVLSAETMGFASGAAIVDYLSGMLALTYQWQNLTNLDPLCLKDGRFPTGSCSDTSMFDVTKDTTVSTLFKCANTAIALDYMCDGNKTNKTAAYDAWLHMTRNVGVDTTFAPEFFALADADPLSVLSGTQLPNQRLNETLVDLLARKPGKTIHHVFLDYVWYLVYYNKPVDLTPLRAAMRRNWEVNSANLVVDGSAGAEVHPTRELHLLGKGVVGVMLFQALFPLFGKTFVSATETVTGLKAAVV